MFTGIITGVGSISRVEILGNASNFGKQVRVSCPPNYLDDVGLGDSIALNGACMTVASLDSNSAHFTVDISSESLSKTVGIDVLGPVNLEKALRANDRLGGHLVSGHVDGIGTVTHFGPVGESWKLHILAPKTLAKYLAYKGSITVNGVSLTVNHIEDLANGCAASINLIPHTVDNTTLGSLKEGAQVNLEIDLIARYVERMLSSNLNAST